MMGRGKPNVATRLCVKPNVALDIKLNVAVDMKPNIPTGARNLMSRSLLDFLSFCLVSCVCLLLRTFSRFCIHRGSPVAPVLVRIPPDILHATVTALAADSAPLRSPRAGPDRISVDYDWDAGTW
jgi:hypothetical protein